MASLTHRQDAYRGLKGQGLEIGALHEPAPMPAGAEVVYLDAMSSEDAAQLFPEIPREKFVPVTYVANLDVDGMKAIPDGSFDFVIINHVMEHLSNPIKALAEVFRVCARGGVVIISIPDKEYTFDRRREITPYEHLWRDFENNTIVSDDDHFIDFLRSAAPHVFLEPPENLAVHVARARSRRDHVHVWTSNSFRDFLRTSMARLKIDAELLTESRAEQNQIEYFTAWRKR